MVEIRISTDVNKVQFGVDNHPDEGYIQIAILHDDKESNPDYWVKISKQHLMKALEILEVLNNETTA